MHPERIYLVQGFAIAAMAFVDLLEVIIDFIAPGFDGILQFCKYDGG